MTQSTKQARRTESGFTLVELAIVMIIIGLLIGGILKGQELITNARVSSTVAQSKAVESGISGFRDKYAAFPGDIAAPSTRLSNCLAASVCGTAATGGTLGDGKIASGAAFDPGAAQALANEAGKAFIHLAAAGLVGGVQPAAANLAASESNPTTPLGGTWAIGTSDGAATGALSVVGLTSGVYIISKATAVGTAVAADNVQVMTPSSAANIDRKLDDGNPTTGSVRGVGAALGAAACADTVTGVTVYNEALGGTLCGVISKVQ